MMNNFLVYLLKSTLIFTVLYGVFLVFLRKLTFHSLNRFILLSSVVLSLFFPLLRIDFFHHSVPQSIIPTINDLIFDGDNFSSDIVADVAKVNIFSKLNIILYLYIAGLSFSAFKLVRNFVLLIQLKRKSLIVKVDDFMIVRGNIDNVFSFGKWIFVPKNNFDFKSPIIEHEKAHIRLIHSFDLIFTELFVVLLWFNPFVYFFRKSLKQIHEFQADAKVLETGLKKSAYLELLLNSLLNDNFVGVYNYFSGLTIKKRVEMITNKKSSKISAYKYFFIAPAILIIILFFANNKNSQLFSQTNVNNFVMKTNMNVPSIFPINKGEYEKISVGFGKHFNAVKKVVKFHSGIDIVAKEGTNIHATADGIVVLAENKDNWGNLIIIKHNDQYETYYAHLSGFNVKNGDKVYKGQIIGYVGNTGMSTGSHLHYEVRKNGKPQNPENFFNTK